MNEDDPELAELRRRAVRWSERVVVGLWIALVAILLLCWANRTGG